MLQLEYEVEATAGSVTDITVKAVTSQHHPEKATHRTQPLKNVPQQKPKGLRAELNLAKAKIHRTTAAFKHELKPSEEQHAETCIP